MSLIKLTLLTQDGANGMAVYFHKDEIRRVIPGRDGSCLLFLLSGDNQTVQENANQVLALVNGPNEVKNAVPKKINKVYEQKAEETV